MYLTVMYLSSTVQMLYIGDLHYDTYSNIRTFMIYTAVYDITTYDMIYI